MTFVANFKTMKKLILSLSFCATALYSLSQACSPDPAVVNMYQPVGSIPLPNDGELEPNGFYVYPGQLLDQTITILAPQQTTVANPLGIPPTITVTINWIRLTNLDSAPSWLSWECGGHTDPTDPCKMAYPTWTCVKATSNEIDAKVPLTEVPGTIYTMDVIIDADVSILGTQNNQVGGQLALVVLENMSVTVNGSASTTCGGSGTATATPAGGFGDPGAYVYSWSNGAFTQTINNLGPGWYICTVTDQVTGWSAIDSVEIVSPAPIVISVNSQSDVIVGSDGAVSVSAIGGTGTLSYSWSGPSGFSSTSTTLTGLNAGLYILTVTDQNGCTAIQTVNILSQVGVNEQKEIEFSVYPNPSNGVIQITGFVNGNSNAMLNVFDMNGSLVFQKSLAAGEIQQQLNLNMLSRGVYTVEIMNNVGKTSSRFVIE